MTLVRTFRAGIRSFDTVSASAHISAVAYFDLPRKGLTASFSTSLTSFTQAKQPRLAGMDNRGTAPYLAQDPTEIGQILDGLNGTAKGGKAKGGFKIRKKTYKISEKDTRTVDSWSMSDWDYKKPNLPIYARGLFTHDNNGKPEIAARGYDKFFNVGEVSKTQWRNVEQNTRGPYELSVKENGCIIFIGGLDDNTLVITSKHSTGPRADASANHALAGEEWIDRQLQERGRTRGDLAKALRKRNVTAVAELCDDSFEEHVLQYAPDQAGLYLHGMNLNLPEFATYPGNLVHDFAEDWGFRKVQYVMKDTIEQVKPFLEEVGTTGNYEGRDTEGFVIRCQAREGPDLPWHDWFFKYKFDEPYLMYRQWREVTKQVIAGKSPRFNKHKKITEQYIDYARRQLAKDPELGKRYNQNHGIIAMRDGFLAEKGLRGHEIIQSEEQQNGDGEGHVKHNVLLVPIATIGCGKTTVAVALTKLFGWGHLQNDNIEGKGRPKRFATAITEAMASCPVVIADRNNHQRRERAQLFEDIGQIITDTTFVGLHYVHDKGDYGAIRQAMQQRILARGDKHQTIHAESKSQNEIIGIMDGFMQRFEPVDLEKRPDNNFDVVIDLDVTSTSRENLATVVNQLHDNYPKLFDMPSDEAMDEAIAYALDEYRPTLKHEVGKSTASKENTNKKPKQNQKNGTPAPSSNKSSAAKKDPRIEFFGVYLPAPRVAAILDAVFKDADPQTSRIYSQLRATRRIQKSFHVTLMHRTTERQEPSYWAKLNDTFKTKAAQLDASHFIGGTDGGVELGTCRVQLERVVWDDRVMTIVTRLLDPEWKSTNAVPHVTVGTASAEIKPKESNGLLEGWLKGTREGVREAGIAGQVVLEGAVRGMISR